MVWLVLLYRRLRYGYAFRRIPVKQGQIAIVDPDDYQRLKKYKWYVCKGKRTFYAVRYIPKQEEQSRKNAYMHYLVIDIPDGMYCDHINHNGLDNRKANLRAATPTQNNRHRRKHIKPTFSIYKGVCRVKGTKLWCSRISVNGKRINLGYFDSEIEAAKAYDEGAKRYHGEFAVLNFEKH